MAVVAVGAIVLVAIGYYVVTGDTGGTEGSGTGDKSVAGSLGLAGVREVPCSAAEVTSPGEPAGITAVLVDRSASVVGPGAAPDYPADLEAIVRDAVERDHAVVLGGFDGTAADVRWSTVHTTFNGDVNRRRLAQVAALGCLMQELRAVVNAPATRSDTDVLGALRAAGDVVRSAPEGKRDLVVATDGIATTGCADLNSVSIGGDVERVIERCRNDLPQLAGTAVTMLGIGDPGASQPPPVDDRQREWVGSLWDAVCRDAGASSCQFGKISRSRMDAPAAIASDARVKWPAIEVVTSPGRATVTLPDGLLFDTGSSTLRADAQTALNEVAEEVRAVSGTVVEVAGHTDSRGEQEANQLLSLGRAQQVADALADQHAVVVRGVRGAGETELRCRPENRPDGTFDSAALQCNRRVEVIIEFSGPPR